MGVALPVLLSVWMSAPEVPPVPQAQPSTSCVVLWREGEPLLLDSRHPQERSTQLVIGDVPPPEALIDCHGPCRVVLLLDGHRLVEVRGPHRWNSATGRLTPFSPSGPPDTDVSTQGPRETLLVDYREAPLRHQFPADCPVNGTVTSLPDIQTPDSPVLRVAPSSIRWISPVRDLRFDLELDELAHETAPAPLERWSNLRSAELPLTVILAPGGTFRIRLLPRESSLVPSLERVFRVASASDLAYYDETSKALDALASTLAPEIVAILRARFLQSEGLWGEARRIWIALAKSHPDLPELLSHASHLTMPWQALD